MLRACVIIFSFKNGKLEAQFSVIAFAENEAEFLILSSWISPNVEVTEVRFLSRFLLLKFIFVRI